MGEKTSQIRQWMVLVDSDMAEVALDQARRFVRRMREFLIEKGFWHETSE